MKALTIRNVDATLARALEREMQRRGTSLNQAVLDLRRQALGLGVAAPPSNGLRQLAGTWSEEDLRSFEQSTAVFEQISRSPADLAHPRQ